MCCRCGFISDEQLKKAFLEAVNRIVARIQILDRKPKKEPIPNNPEFNKLDQRIEELEAEGRYSSNELPALIFKRAQAFYKTVRIDDAEYNTEKMKQAFSGRQPLTEFNEELFLAVVKQITVYADHRLVFEFINGLTMEAGY